MVALSLISAECHNDLICWPGCGDYVMFNDFERAYPYSIQLRLMRVLPVEYTLLLRHPWIVTSYHWPGGVSHIIT